VKTITLAILAAFIATVAATPADARHRHHIYRHQQHTQPIRTDKTPVMSYSPIETTCDNNGRCIATQPYAGPVKIRVTMHRDKRAAHYRRDPGMTVGEERERPQARNYQGDSIQPHPAGCPRIAFCGCGVSVRVFGHAVRNLYLAANWFKFPRAAAGPGMVAVRNHHVMLIERMDGNGNAVVYDPNGGHHMTYIHTRSLAGYSIHNPNGGSVENFGHHRRYASR